MTKTFSYQSTQDQSTHLEQSTVLVGGARVHYCWAGSGPPLVLIHGLVGSARNWDRNIEALAQVRTVYAPDSVNMGQSERRPGVDPGIESQVARIVEWMDRVNIPSADVVAHSHGASISIVLAARHPDRVRKLVLFAPANPFCTLGLPQVRFYGTFLGGLFARRIIPLLPTIMYRRSLERLYGDSSRIAEGVLEGYTDGLNTPTITHIVDVMRGWDSDMAILADALPKLHGARTLLLWGDKDRAVSLASGRQIAQRIGAQLIVIEGAGHVPFQEKPEECNAALLAWLTL